MGHGVNGAHLMLLSNLVINIYTSMSRPIFGNFMLALCAYTFETAVSSSPPKPCAAAIKNCCSAAAVSGAKNCDPLVKARTILGSFNQILIAEYGV